MTQQSVMDRLAEIDNLPTLPVVAGQVQKLIMNPKSNMAQIATVISRDQAIAARVIRLVNSAFYGLRSRITSIQQAIVILGLNTVKNLVVAVSVVKTFEEPGAASLFDREKLWLHAFGCAHAAKLMARLLGRPEPEDYFLAGLLHDTGILILDQFVHEQFVEVLHHALRGKVGYVEAERGLLGTSHGEVGEFVARRWNLPAPVLEAMRGHHLPRRLEGTTEQGFDLTAFVNVADAVANNAGVHMGYYSGQQDPDGPALKQLGIGRAALEEVGVRVRGEVRSLMTEWGL